MNKIDINEELHNNFISYSNEFNKERAFPDARDGLKPGQRACLWEMYSKGYTTKKPHVKSAKVSGGVIATWWPHGDVAIYETFARMSQSWINNLPEVDFHGSNGNQIIGGDALASARYTEVRLSKAIEDGMFTGIKQDTVDMILNFSEDEKWPSVLPAIFPRLLVNGSQGIGSGLAQVWLPHNLKEVGNLILNYIEKEELDITNFAPDFPSGGIIINQKDLKPIYSTGKGKTTLRGTAEIKNDSILITELPYQVYVEPLIDDIKEEIKKEKAGFVHIKNIFNKSDKKRMLIEIECAKGTAEKVLKTLYAFTDMQKNYNANQNALVSKTPTMLNLKEYIDIYISHNIEVIQREYDYSIEKAKEKLEVVEGLLKALEDIDNIITLIKSSKSSDDAKMNLENKYSFTSNQSKAIVDMRLGKLANLEYVELQNKQIDLSNTITEANNILSSTPMQKDLLSERLKTFITKYGDERKTKVTSIDTSGDNKEISNVISEDVMVIINKAGEIKKVPKKSYKVQNKGGKGVKAEKDAILSAVSANTIDTLLVFTNFGQMYQVLVDNIPTGTNATKGSGIGNLIELKSGEEVMAITPLQRETDKKYVVFITKKGLIKKSLLTEYTATKRKAGIIAIKIKEGDSIANIEIMNEEQIICFSKQGQCIRFETSLINPTGRATSGVKAINLSEDDEVLVGLTIDPNKKVAVFNSEGLGRRSELSEFTVQGRGGKGIKGYKNDTIVGAAMVGDEDIILLSGDKTICVAAKDISIQSRTSVGISLLKGNLASVVVL